MNDATRHVLQAMRGNGFEVEIRRGEDAVGVVVVDPRRRAESSFGFNAMNETEVVDEMARCFCSVNQRAEIFGGDTLVAADGPYRYAMV